VSLAAGTAAPGGAIAMSPKRLVHLIPHLTNAIAAKRWRLLRAVYRPELVELSIR
jgi:hypothetical protein